MRISSIALTNFRNFSSFSHSFKKDLVIFCGPNATGKTNLLESIQLLSLSKSFRARNDLELINWEKNFTKVEGLIKNEEINKIEINISKLGQKAQKIIKINDRKIKASDLIGNLTIVFFSPEDLDLVFASPSVRRRYLDMVLCQTSNKYYQNAIELKKVILNRNRLLFEIKEKRADISQLKFWDKKLINLSKTIIQNRKEMINFYNRFLSFIYQKISGDDQKKFFLQYQPGLPFSKENFQNFETIFANQLENKKEEEIEKCQTLIGPHRDDFIFLLDNKKLSAFGSRGEFRTAVLALKSIELNFLEKQKGERPILLLDDIFSELDRNRQNQLINIIPKQQTFITTTDLSLIDKKFLANAEILSLPNLNSNGRTNSN